MAAAKKAASDAAAADKKFDDDKKKQREEITKKYHESEKQIGEMEKTVAGDLAKEGQEGAKVQEQFHKALEAASGKNATPDDTAEAVKALLSKEDMSKKI